VLFDASTTSDPDNAIVLYSWSFGDGSTATGRTVTHTFTAATNYQVTLTVSDSLGRAASTTTLVNVGATTPPTAQFVFSPTQPATGQEIVFNATSSTAATGRTIVAYNWEFGTGRTASGSIVSKTYDTAGTYKVTLKVTDDVGRFDTDEQSVPVTAGGAGGVTAAFTFSPSNPKVGTTVYFDGTPSTSPAGVTSYQWNFGDGTTATGQNVSHAFGAAATYVVRLTITDAQGKTATTTQSVTVAT
jgi:PKD repeat protein